MLIHRYCNRRHAEIFPNRYTSGIQLMTHGLRLCNTTRVRFIEIETFKKPIEKDRHFLRNPRWTIDLLDFNEPNYGIADECTEDTRKFIVGRLIRQ